MYNNPQRPPFNPLKIIILMIIAIVIVIGVTYALNGGGSANTTTTENTTNETNDTAVSFSVQPTLVGNSSLGTVYKYAGYGNTASDVKIALIIGIDEDSSQAESVLPTMENTGNLRYSYDVYVVNATNDTNSSDDGNLTNSSTNSSKKNSSDSNSTSSNSEALAKKYVVSDIVDGNYDFTAEIHSSSNESFLFVPSDDTYTSKEVVNSISNSTGIKKQTPSSYKFARGASIPLIENNVPSMVYMTTSYYSSEPSDDIMLVIGAINNFDFKALYATDSASVSDLNSSSNNTNSGDDNSSSNNTTSNRVKVSQEVDE